jgi:hypothetical protein
MSNTFCHQLLYSRNLIPATITPTYMLAHAVEPGCQLYPNGNRHPFGGLWQCDEFTNGSGVCTAICHDGYIGVPTPPFAVCRSGNWSTVSGSCQPRGEHFACSSFNPLLVITLPSLTQTCALNYTTLCWSLWWHILQQPIFVSWLDLIQPPFFLLVTVKRSIQTL